MTRQQIAAGFEPEAAIPAIEQAMAVFEKGGDYLPAKAIYDLPVAAQGAYAACIAGYTEAAGLLSMKVGQERTDNPSRQLPTTNSWILVFEPVTGELLMICDGTLPTMLRTAAAASVAAKHLARANAKTLAVIGAGQLGRQCMRQASTVRDFETLYVFDQFEQAAEQAVNELGPLIKPKMVAADARTVCSQADVIVTATNSRSPIVKADWVRPGTHLSCMGTDLHDKIECEMSLLPGCRIFADQTEHAVKRGEVSQAVEQGVLGEDCYAGTLGQVINGEVVGREDDQQVTMYDGVGIGIQDTTVCRTIYNQAVDKDLGTPLAFS